MVLMARLTEVGAGFSLHGFPNVHTPSGVIPYLRPGLVLVNADHAAAPVGFCRVFSRPYRPHNLRVYIDSNGGKEPTVLGRWLDG